jgi:hypothetical protein
MTTREEWLIQATLNLKQFFQEQGREIPPSYVVSCGWPSKDIRKTIGQCFDPKTTKEGITQIFVSPLMDEPIRILDILLHELAHHVVGLDHKHRGPFLKLIRGIGLEGKPTATYAGETLKKRLEPIAEKLGPYPNPAINLSLNDQKKLPAKRLKLISPVDPDYNVWISPTFLQKHGPPLCPICEEPMIVEKKIEKKLKKVCLAQSSRYLQMLD